MNSLLPRRVLPAVALAAALFGASVASPAYAGESYNNATVAIKGGNAAALSACVNYAKIMLQLGRPAQSNACRNFATAVGGTVSLNSVSISILQAGSGGPLTLNNAVVQISGGDASALASCVNYLQGTVSAAGAQKCMGSATAIGGAVSLKDVNITVIQG